MIDIKAMLVQQLHEVMHENNDSKISDNDALAKFGVDEDLLDHIIEDCVTAIHSHLDLVTSRLAFRIRK
jgi:hypothetical protein